jgi:hypothetical protein
MGIDISHPWARLIVICIVLYVFYIILFRKLKDVKLVRKIFFKVAKLDFFIPILILVLVLVIEYFFMKYLSNDNYHFGEIFAIESMIIITSFLLLFYYTIWLEFRKENIDEGKFWDNYAEILSKSEKRILSLNVRDFSLFFMPLAVRYYYKQAEILEKKKKDNRKILAQRIIVLPNEKKEDLADYTIVKNALKEKSFLNDNERIFFNIERFHDLMEIELYLIPKKILLTMVINNINVIEEAWFKHVDENNFYLKKFINKQTFRLFKKKIAIKILDSLVIDDNSFYVTNKGKNLLFYKLPEEFTTFINSVFENITAKPDTYRINEIKKRVNKQKA